jgi:hypothetical protein
VGVDRWHDGARLSLDDEGLVVDAGEESLSGAHDRARRDLFGSADRCSVLRRCEELNIRSVF